MDISSNFKFHLPSKYSDDIVDVDVLSDNFRIIDDVMVAKEQDKQLSSNDFTNDEKSKLESIEHGAQVNNPVDQNYDPQSENAQSGKAVNQAINNASEALNQKINQTSEYLNQEITKKEKNYYQNFANALKGTASGATVTLKDVSPLGHEVKVKMSGETTGVVASGKTNANTVLSFKKPQTNFTIKTGAFDKWGVFYLQSGDEEGWMTEPAFYPDMNEIPDNEKIEKVSCVYEYSVGSEGAQVKVDVYDETMDNLLFTGYQYGIFDLNTVEIDGIRYSGSDDNPNEDVQVTVTGTIPVYDQTEIIKNVEFTQKGDTVMLNAPSDSVHMVLESGDNFTASGTIPLVDGQDLTKLTDFGELAITPRYGYGDGTSRVDLTYTITDKVLSWVGVENLLDVPGAEPMTISGSYVLESSGQKIIGFAQVYGLDEDNPASEYPEYDTLYTKVTVYDKSTPDITLTVGGKNFIDSVTYVPEVDGTVKGVKSIYPSMSFTTNNPDVWLDIEYNRDIIKAMEEKTPSEGTITIDQRYNPESENAQSGIAVAEAIDNKFTTSSKAEEPDYSEELASADGWTLNGWSGDFVNGFTSASGNTTPLVFAMPEETGTNTYRISFRCSTQIGVEYLTVRCGNSEPFDLYGQPADPIVLGITSVENGNLEFKPSNTFTGTITDISVKRVTTRYRVKQKITDSTGTISCELRPTKASQENVFLGKRSGMNNISGWGCASVGSQALENNTSGFWNIGVGHKALYSNTVGSRNIGIGYIALTENITGTRNIAIGSYALHYNKTGNHNVGIGSDSLDHNVSGSENVAVGHQAMYHNESGSKNTAFGVSALTSVKADFNTAVGHSSLRLCSTGAYNVGLGYGAGSNITTGSTNLAIGTNSLYKLKTGDYNIGIGSNAGRGHGATVGNFKHGIFIGTQAGYNLCDGADYNIFISYKAGYNTTRGTNNICIGENTYTPTPETSYWVNIGGLYEGSREPNNKYAKINGGLQLSDIPTSDPAIAGRVWNDNGTLKVSAG